MALAPNPEQVRLSLWWVGALRGALLEKFVSMTLSEAQLQQLSPTALAYIGDAVYELFVRSSFLIPPLRIQTYHETVVNQVRAERQAQHLRVLTPYLTEAEQDILRKGRNAATRGPRRVDPQIYQQASSFESLIGYLYLTDPNRLTELLSHIELSPHDAQGVNSPEDG